MGNLLRTAGPYGQWVSPEDAWSEYSRARLPAGWTYVLGREAIEQGLLDAGARVGRLSLGRPDLPRRGTSLTIFDVLWLGDARAGYYGPGRLGADLLLMRWTAVPHGVAVLISEEVQQLWLPVACTWAAQAVRRGNAWSASEHRWLLRQNDLGLHVQET